MWVEPNVYVEYANVLNTDNFTVWLLDLNTNNFDVFVFSEHNLYLQNAYFKVRELKNSRHQRQVNV